MRILFSVFVIIFPLGIFAEYEISICTIFQNEAPYLKEWIEFHKLQGVDHFYLYNNNSADDYLSVLKPYIKSKEVTLTEWPQTYTPGNRNEWLAIQRGAYMHCVSQYGANTKWLAAIDADEFLFCPNGEALPDFFQRYIAYGGVCVNWLLFGTSHVKTLPPGYLMIEILTMCSLKDNVRNFRIKSIVQPKHVWACDSAHSFLYKKGYFAVGVDGNKIEGGNSAYVSQDKIRINHYWTRAEDHFNQKKIQSRHNRRFEENEINLTAMADGYNLSINTDILQFVPDLREKMGYD